METVFSQQNFYKLGRVYTLSYRIPLYLFYVTKYLKYLNYDLMNTHDIINDEILCGHFKDLNKSLQDSCMQMQKKSKKL